MRRGHATANAEFGNAASVLVGDFLYSRAFQMMVGVARMRVLEILADTTNAIAEGEVLQLINAGDADLDEAAYLNVIYRKTARLFEAASRIGAVLGGAPPNVEDALARYGMHLGTAFQLVDDILDYSGDAEAIGKNVGDDLAEGKMTLPLIHALANGTAEEGAVIRHAIAGGGRTDFAPVVPRPSPARERSPTRGRMPKRRWSGRRRAWQHCPLRTSKTLRRIDDCSLQRAAGDAARPSHPRGVA